MSFSIRILTIGLLLQIADSLGFRLSGTNVFCSMFIIARWAARNNADTAAVSAALSEKYYYKLCLVLSHTVWWMQFWFVDILPKYPF